MCILIEKPPSFPMLGLKIGCKVSSRGPRGQSWTCPYRPGPQVLSRNCFRRIPLILEPGLQSLGETLLVQMGLGFCNQPRAGQISNIAEPAMIDLVKDHVRDKGVPPAQLPGEQSKMSTSPEILSIDS